MQLVHLLRRIRHASTAVPRLVAAARRSGLGPLGVIEVLRISEGSLRLAATHGSGTPGRINAMRHFMWQALITARLGIEPARTIAVAQEAGSADVRDTAVDEHNNAVGQAYGSEHAADLRQSSLAAALRAIVPVALAKWDGGELASVRPRPSR